MTDEKNIPWLTAPQRKLPLSSCAELGGKLKENIEATKAKTSALKDKMLAPEVPVADMPLYEKKIHDAEHRRNEMVRKFWMNPFKRGEMRDENDTFYFMFEWNKEWKEYNQSAFYDLRDSKLGQYWEYLVCKLDQKNATLVDA